MLISHGGRDDSADSQPHVFLAQGLRLLCVSPWLMVRGGVVGSADRSMDDLSFLGQLRVYPFQLAQSEMNALERSSLLPC